MFDPNRPPVIDNNESIAERFVQKIESEKSLEFLKDLFVQLPELEMYLVGGMVRDTIIEYPTSKDYDFIARGVDPDKLIDILKTKGKVSFVGRTFGVLKFRPHDSTLTEDIDIAFPRTEVSEGTGGYKDVKTTSDHNLPVEEDLRRRDLTINAIAWNVQDKIIIDPYNGQLDLEAGIVKTVGDPRKRFQEDYSRMLRAIRFACRFEFDIDPETFTAVKELMTHINDEREITMLESLNRKLDKATKQTDIDRLKKQISKQENTAPEATMNERIVPMETVTKEILKTLGKNPVRALEMFERTGVLSEILPNVAELKNNPELWEQLQKTLKATSNPEVEMYTQDIELTPACILGILMLYASRNAKEFSKLDDFGKSTLGQTLKKMRVDVEDIKMIKSVVGGFEAIDGPEFEKLTVQEKYLVSEYGSELIAMRFLVSVAEEKDDTVFEDKLRHLYPLLNNEGELPKPLINGKDIIETLKLKRGGKIIGETLTAVREEQLQGNISTREQAIEIIRTYEK